MALDKLNSRRYREQRERVFMRDGRSCQLCGTDEGEMHIDHIIPRKVGGDHSLDNLRVLCKSCNLRKGAKNGSHYGIPQGRSIYLKTATIEQQIKWGLKYIHNRYGYDTCKAWQHWKDYNWH